MTGPGISNHRYEAETLATKHGWMQQGHGSAAAYDARHELGKIAEALASSDEQLRDNLQRRLRLAWQGCASSAAADALACAADEVLGTSRSGTAGASTVEQYGGSFDVLKRKIAAPVLEGENSIWGRGLEGALGEAKGFAADVFDVQSDHYARVKANKQADALANQALYAHEAAARQALAAFPISDSVPTRPIEGAALQGLPDRSAANGGAAGGRFSSHQPQGGVPGAHRPPAAGATNPTGIGDARPTGTGDASRSGADHSDPTWPGHRVPVGVESAGAATNGAAIPDGGHPGAWRPVDPHGPSGYGPVPWPSVNRGYDATERDLTPRGGTGTGERTGSGSSSSSAGSSQKVPSGMSGSTPIMGAGGAGAGDRQHRNSTYLPSDEPFRVDLDDVSPAVLGTETVDHR